jgi:enoyl-CoA hydratase
VDYETVLYEQVEHVVTLTYNRPDQHNAINRKMNAELHHAWQRFRDDRDAFVLVITGAGASFSAGWDLQDAAEFDQIGDWDAFRVGLYNNPGDCGYTRRVDIFKLVIAAENAEFGAPERRWNIVGGDGMTVRLPLVVGFAKAMELVITGRRVSAHEALRIGLVNEVVPRGQALATAQALAHQIAVLPQGAIRSDKESILRGIGRTLEERLRIEAEMIISMFMRWACRWPGWCESPCAARRR